MNNIKELSTKECLTVNGGGWWDDIKGPLEDWLEDMFG